MRLTGKGLAAHLQVPLPYLLYRVHARFQEELRGLQDIPGVLSPSVVPPKTEPLPIHESPQTATRALGQSARLSGSGPLSTPTRIRARLTSIGSNYSRKITSSTITVQDRRPRQPSRSSEESDSEEEEALKEEEAERQAEEQEALDRKLKELQSMMTNETLGLVSSGRKGKSVADRGRMGIRSPVIDFEISKKDNLSRSTSQSLSSASSPQGSIPEIPSPPPDSQPHSPMKHHMSHKSSSPPAVSPRSVIGQRYVRATEQGSSHGSQASSFSDISGRFFYHSLCIFVNA